MYVNGYSPVRMPGLSSFLSAGEYNNIMAVPGQSYKIWLTMPPQDYRVWTTLYKGKDTQTSYKDEWNKLYGSTRFLITAKPLVDNAKGIIYIEGKAIRAETFAAFALDAAWARLNPWYTGGGSWRGIEKVHYGVIKDGAGRDLYEGAPEMPGEPAGDDTTSTNPLDTLSNLTSSLPKVAGISVLWIGAAVAVVGGAILLARKKRS